MTTNPLGKVIRRTVLRLGPTSQWNDRQLLEHFATAHDEAAFEELVRRHGPMVQRVCRNVLGNAADADDALQATLIVLAKKAATVALMTSVAGWLHGVAHRVALKAKVSAARRRAHERQPALVASCTGPFTSDQAGAEVLSALHEELGQLPDKYRVPVVLCYLQAKTNEEAAVILGRPMGTISYQLSRARELLRHRLMSRGVALPASGLAALHASATADAGACLMPGPMVEAVLLATTSGSAATVPQKLATAFLRPSLGRRLRNWAALGFLAGMLGIGPWLLLRAPATALSATSVGGHTGRVNCLATSPDGRWVASGSDDCIVKLRDTRTGKACADLSGHTMAVTALTFAPDSSLLATTGLDGTVRLWEIPGGTVYRVLQLHAPERESRLHALAFSTQGRLLAAGSWRGDVKLWDVPSGEPRAIAAMGTDEAGKRHDPTLTQLGTFEPHWDVSRSGHRGLFGLGFCDNDRTLIAGTNGFRMIWFFDVATGDQRRPRGGSRNNGMIGCVSPGGRYILIATPELPVHEGGNRAELLDAKTLEVRVRLSGHTKKIAHAAFSADGHKLATMDWDCCVRLWDVETGQQAAVLQAPPATTGIAVAIDGQTIIFGCTDGSVKFQPVIK